MTNWPAPTPLGYFASLVASDEGLPLLEAAASVALDEHPGLDVQAVLSDVDRLGRRLRQRIARDAAPLQRLSALTQYFHGELGFAGNLNDYYEPGNSWIHRVLSTRRGIPITLAILMLELAEQAGLRASGVAFPGHFLVKFKIGLGEVVVDPFTGESLSVQRLDELLQLYRQGSGLPEDLELPLEFFLRAATPRHILARLLRNLKEIYRAAQDWPRLLAVQERLVLLLPDELGERRDRGLALEAVGAWARAVEDLEHYLRLSPAPVDGPALRALLERLRARD
jgi:regulator of sirC expression with transglutaminase-like and TPR domain